MIPGSNILNMALTLIGSQVVTYYRYDSRSTNSVGQDITIYLAPATLSGSFQPVPRRLYEVYGLDLQKKYATFYSSNNILDVSRDVSGDQLTYAGRKYQVESSNDWFVQDGWKGLLCVEIGADNG